MKTLSIVAALTTLLTTGAIAEEYLGNLSANPNNANSTSNPYATDAPKLYDSQGNYRGRLSDNPYGQGMEIYGE